MTFKAQADHNYNDIVMILLNLTKILVKLSLSWARCGARIAWIPLLLFTSKQRLWNVGMPRLSGPLLLNVMSLLLRKCKGGLQSAYLDSEISVMPNAAEVNST